MSVSLLAWAKATLKHCQPAAAIVTAAAPAMPTFRLSACFAAASAARQHRLIPNQVVWRQADMCRRSFASQAANASHSVAKSYPGFVLVASAATAGAVALYLGNTAGEASV